MQKSRKHSEKHKAGKQVKFRAWALMVALHNRESKTCFQVERGDRLAGKERGGLIYYQTFYRTIKHHSSSYDLGPSLSLTCILRITRLSILKFIFLPIARVTYVSHMTLSLSCLKLFPCS